MSEIYNEPLIDLVNGCVNKNRKSQEIVFKKFHGKMLGICMRYSKDKEEARDILQDSFIKVYSNIKNYGGNGSFEGWIRRIVTNTAIDFYRRHKHSEVRAGSEIVESTGESITEDEGEEPDYLSISPKEILNAVQNLSPAYRTVFSLYAIDGFSHKEIAEKLGINEGTSKSNFSKAKVNLRKALKDKIKPADQIRITSYK